MLFRSAGPKLEGGRREHHQSRGGLESQWAGLNELQDLQ